MQPFNQPVVGQRTLWRSLCLLGLLTLVLSLIGPMPEAAFAQAQAPTRTQWQMIRMTPPLIAVTDASIIKTSKVLDLVNTEPKAKIPAQDASGWQTAPIVNNQVLFDSPSRVKDCNKQLDFTYFQTILTIPANYIINTIQVSITQVDDYARVYLNDKYDQKTDLLPPDGKNGKTFSVAPSTLKPGPNRIVIVQVDHCGGGNRLRNPQVDLTPKGSTRVTEVPVASAPLKLDPWQIIRAKDIVPLAAGVTIRTASVLDQAGKTIPISNTQDWKQVKGLAASVGASINVDPNTGQERLKFGINSRIKTCNKQLDFTYFQTFVTVPQGFTITKAQVVMPIVDDYARVYVYTPAESTTPKFNPAGDVISPNMKKGETPLDISGYLAAGKKSRIVIVQVDHCAPGNSLTNAFATIEGR